MIRKIGNIFVILYCLMRSCQDYKITFILRISIMHSEAFHITMAAAEGTSNIELANRIIDNNLHQNTKRQYSNKVKHMYEWFKEHHQELCTPPDCAELELNLIATTRDGSDALKEFYAHISKKKNRDGSYKDPVVHQSFENVSGYKSAIKNHFKSKRVKFSDESELLQSEFFGGYKRLIAEEKQDGTRKVREGKVPLTFSVYRFIAKLALQYDRDFYCSVFANVVLVLCWNLVARCVSVASLMYNHISWKEDAMVIVFPTTKADQEGKNCSPKHVFANPENPEICPILSFAIYVFTFKSMACFQLHIHKWLL